MNISEKPSDQEAYELVLDFVKDNLEFLDPRHYHLVAVWSLATHRVHQWLGVPYLHFWAPTESGKSRALDVLRLLCFNPIPTFAVRPANIYRLIEKNSVTLLIDETDMESKEFENLMLKILNSGYTRGGYIYRTEKDEDGEFYEREFSTFGFKAIAGLDELAQTLKSRCIQVSMVRLSWIKRRDKNGKIEES